MKNGVELIKEERDRQINTLNWTKENDAKYTNNELAIAGVCYAYPNYNNDYEIQSLLKFPWDNKYWKPSPNNRIRDLQKAGALIAAEIDRLIELNKNDDMNTGFNQDHIDTLIDQVIGMDFENGSKLFKHNNFTSVSISRSDENYYIITADVNFKRINFELDNGLITRAYVG